MARRPIIIDTDPGVDDAVAILLALASPELAVLGLSAVAGNRPLERTQSNARALCELAGRAEVPVFAGCARPILGPTGSAERFHGSGGLGDFAPPAPRLPLGEAHAVDWMIETLRGAGDGEIALCALGPLTNLAVALIKEPAIRPKIREIVMMGGSLFAGGNVTPAAEFNIHCDPHAAAVVFSSGCPLTLMPRDVALAARATEARFARLEAIDSDVGRACVAMLSFYRRQHAARYGHGDIPLYDPCVTAYLLRPEIFAGRRVAVQIETNDSPTLGMTVIDWHGVTAAEPNCQVMNEIDAEAFFDLVLGRLATL